jgi:hypothetical protein
VARELVPDDAISRKGAPTADARHAPILERILDQLQFGRWFGL